MNLGVIGCGKMGRALLGGIIESGLCSAEDVLVFDAFPAAMESLSRDLGVRTAQSNAEVVTSSEVILLCVKPQGFLEMLAEIGESTGKLLISIAAGIPISRIEDAVTGSHRVIRVMPNTPALVGKGASAFSLGTTATKDDAALTSSLLEAVGYACEVSEDKMDAVTAVSGSGPAYIFLLIEALVAGGIDQGLPENLALDLAAHTVSGAATLLLESVESPSQLRENVTSPNGTTFAALESFRADEFESIVRRAVAAAAERSKELASA